MKNILKSALAFASGLLALALAGCGGDSGSSTGPASGDAFAGTSISFNPTVNFSTGGNLTYFNDETDSPFPEADPAVDGTYTYVPNATFTAGTLTLFVSGVQDPIVLDISNFTRTGPNVTGFTARSGGQSYPVTVTGTLVAYQRPGAGGGGSGGSGEASAADLPESMRGTYELTYFEATAGSGIADDSTQTFIIGARSLAFGGKTLTDPVFLNGNTLEWIFKDGNLWYAVSQNNLGGLNEINVGGPNGTPFYGQYSDESSSSGGGGYNSIGIGANGAYVGGGFTARVSNVVGPDTVPSGADLFVQFLPQGEDITFTFSNNGDLLSPNLVGVFNFSADGGTTVTYTQLRPNDNPAVADTITIQKAQNGLPLSLSVYSVRTGTRTTQVTYTLDVNVP